MTEPLKIGRIMQSVKLITGIAQAVGGPLAPPTSVSLQVAVPWSNTQSWPPPVSGSPGLLCSLTEMSGTHTEPSVPVKVNGDQLTAVAGVKPKPLLGKVVPSLHVAHARFCSMKVNAVVVAAIRRIRRATRGGAFVRTAATLLDEMLVNSEVIVPLDFVASVRRSPVDRAWFTQDVVYTVVGRQSASSLKQRCEVRRNRTQDAFS